MRDPNASSYYCKTILRDLNLDHIDKIEEIDIARRSYENC